MRFGQLQFAPRGRASSADKAPATTEPVVLSRAAMRHAATTRSPTAHHAEADTGSSSFRSFSLIRHVHNPGYCRRLAASSVPPDAEFAKCLVGDADDVRLDKLQPFTRSIFRMLQRAFPFDNGPTVRLACVILENTAPTTLPVTERAEAACTVDPALIAAMVFTPPPGRIEFRILDVEHLDAVLVDVDIVEIIEAP